MSPRWEDVNARARGLGTHLLARGDLDALARQADLPALADALGRAGIVPLGDQGTEGAPALERGIRHWAGALLGILGRWVGERSAALPLVFDLEDRRSLRALFRGAVAGAPADRRLAALLPTPALPERALETLAALPTVESIAALVSAWRHPFAKGLAEVTKGGAPDLLAIERALGRVALASAVRSAVRSGSRQLRVLVAEGIDLENVTQALVLARAGETAPPAEWFLAGGTLLTLEDFTEALGMKVPAEAGRRLAKVFTGTPFAQAILEGAADPARLETDLLARRIALLAERVRVAPLEPLTTLWVAFRIRAQVIDLQRVVWTIALGAPRPPLLERWASVAA